MFYRIINKIKFISWQVFRKLMPHKLVWKGGINYELDHWNHFFTWPSYKKDLTFRLNPNAELQTEIRGLFSNSIPETLTILDVGAGPLTKLGKKWNYCKIEILPIDPLADHYNKLMLNFNIKPIVSTENLKGEDILNSKLIKKKYFDIAYCYNALDHTYDPLLVIQGMISAVKKDGFIYLNHRPYESQRTNGKGFHQWDFFEKDGSFFIQGKKGTFNVNKILNKLCVISCKENIVDTSEFGELITDKRLVVVMKVL